LTATEFSAAGETEVASKPDAVSPLVAVLRTFLAPVQETPKPTSRRVTKTRLLTSDEFINELARKEEERKKQETEKGAARKRKKFSAKKKEVGHCMQTEAREWKQEERNYKEK